MVIETHMQLKRDTGKVHNRHTQGLNLHTNTLFSL